MNQKDQTDQDFETSCLIYNHFTLYPKDERFLIATGLFVQKEKENIFKVFDLNMELVGTFEEKF